MNAYLVSDGEGVYVIVAADTRRQALRMFPTDYAEHCQLLERDVEAGAGDITFEYERTRGVDLILSGVIQPNWYKPGDSLGLHVDKTEYDLSRPIVTISLGADAAFQIGDVNRDAPIREIIVSSGDVLVFGGQHRLIWHGVKKVYDATLFSDLGMKTPGRISLTIRQVMAS